MAVLNRWTIEIKAEGLETDEQIEAFLDAIEVRICEVVLKRFVVARLGELNEDPRISVHVHT